jgi:hypothetical protein
MARTAPDVEGTVTQTRVSWRFIDVSGDRRAVSLICDPAITNATLEAATEAIGEATNANLWEVTRTQVWGSLPVASAAAAEREDTVYNNIVILYKAPGGDSRDFFIPAPVHGMFVGETDNVNNASSIYETVRDTVEACLTNAFEPVTARYTERREINKAVPAE